MVNTRTTQRTVVESVRVGKVAVFAGQGLPIVIRKEECLDPGAGELAVCVDAAGVCGSDVHRRPGDVRAPDRPICFGHEAVGTIEVIGPGEVSDYSGQALSVRDCIYWTPSTPCSRCDAFEMDNQMRCNDLPWRLLPERPNAAGSNDCDFVCKTQLLQDFRRHSVISCGHIRMSTPHGPSRFQRAWRAWAECRHAAIWTSGFGFNWSGQVVGSQRRNRDRGPARNARYCSSSGRGRGFLSFIDDEQNKIRIDPKGFSWTRCKRTGRMRRELICGRRRP